jgi:hypothetical protein
MLAQPFDRQDVPSGHFAHRRETRTYRLSVDKHCAGTTFSFVITALFGTGQTQLAPQDIEQGAGGVDI